MRPANRVMLAAAIALGLASMPDARAADVPPEAKARFEAGDAAYRLGDFRRAIEEWKTSYQLFPAPLLLYNLGQAYRQLGDNEKALFAYRQYVSLAPAGRFRLVAEQKIVELSAVIEQQRRTREAPPPGSARLDAEQAPPAPPAQPRSDVHPSAEQRKAVSAAAVSPKVDTPAPPPSGLGWRPGAALAIVGVAAIISGGVLMGFGESRYNGANATYLLGDRNQERADGRGLYIAGAVVLGIGAAVAATGGGLLLARVLGRRADRHALWLLPSGCGLAAGGVFP